MWLVSGPASLLGEEVPPGLLVPSALLLAPPPPISPIELLPDQLSAAWQGGVANALAIAGALSQRAGRTLPWTAVRAAIEGAIRARMLELPPGSGAWPCEFPAASTVTLAVLSAQPPSPHQIGPTYKPNVRVGEAHLTPGQIQDLAEVMGDVLKAKGSLELTFQLRVEVAGKEVPSDAAIDAINAVLRTVSSDIGIR